MSSYLDWPLRALATALQQGELSASEVMAATLERVEARNPPLNAFVTLCAEQALEEARQRDAEAREAENAARRPLFGLPYSAKDLTPTAGVRTTMGTRLLETNVPQSDAIAIQRLKAAGAILIGKTTTPEFGHKPLTEGPLFGRTLNPWNAAFTCGGSSGGAAVAAATGMGAFALGTDGGGSIRIPSSCCGIVGLKATLGAIPHLDVPDLFAANSFVGPMARRVDDVRLVWQSLRGPSRYDPYGQTPHPRRTLDKPASLEGLRIGLLATVGDHAVEPVVARAFERAAGTARDLGASLQEIAFDALALEDAFLVILESILGARLGDSPATDRDRLDPTLVRSVEKGARHSAAALQKAQAARSRAFREIQALFDQVDLILSPTLTAPSIPVDQDPHAEVVIAGRPNGRIRAGWYPYTYPFNLTGHPALSLPCGRDAVTNLPIGLQVVGPWHSEDLLLDAAACLELAFGEVRAA